MNTSGMKKPKKRYSPSINSFQRIGSGRGLLPGLADVAALQLVLLVEREGPSWR